MLKSVARPLAVAAVSVLAVGALGAGPASAGGDHGGHHGDHHGYDVTIPLTEKVSDELRDGANRVVATGKADAWTSHGSIVLSFPVRGDERRTRGSGAWALGGGVAFTGAGPDVSWTRLRMSFERGIVTAKLSGGDRAAILRFAGHDRAHARHGGDSHGGKLVLTAAGAASLNRAAAGSPFEAGDAFTGSDCDH